MFHSVTITLLLSLLFAHEIAATTFGEPDGNDHPHVGTLLFVQNGEGYYSCTGTMISPTVMLTAGHCVKGDDSLNDVTYVRFDENALEGLDTAPNLSVWFRQDWIQANEVIAHPLYDDFGGFPYTYDIGLVILNNRHAVDLPVYGELPPLNFLQDVLDARGQSTNSWTNVGYGMQGYINPFYSNEYVRRQSTSTLIELNSLNTGFGDQSAKYSNNPGGAGSGGTCFGDSGGPQFYQDTNIIGSITSFGITPCIGNDFSFRVDTEVAQDFICEYADCP